MGMFANFLVESIMDVNKKSSEGYGVFYPLLNEKNDSMHVCSDTRYWNRDESLKTGAFFLRPNKKPSDAIKSFFNGPTYAECGMVIVACAYQAILKSWGQQLFDDLFGSRVSPLFISRYLYEGTATKKQIKYHANKTLFYRLSLGNPLFHFFDEVDARDNNDIKWGDIVYVEGVDGYLDKHPAGFLQGWNMVCVGKNMQGENMFAGFESAAEKRYSMHEIKELLILAYNEKLSDGSKWIAKNLLRKIENSDNALECLAASNMIQMMHERKNHQVDEQHPIGGIRKIIRFNEGRFTNYCKKLFQKNHSNSLLQTLCEKKYITISYGSGVKKTIKPYVNKLHPLLSMIHQRMHQNKGTIIFVFGKKKKCNIQAVLRCASNLGKKIRIVTKATWQSEINLAADGFNQFSTDFSFGELMDSWVAMLMCSFEMIVVRDVSVDVKWFSLCCEKAVQCAGQRNKTLVVEVNNEKTMKYLQMQEWYSTDYESENAFVLR